MSDKECTAATHRDLLATGPAGRVAFVEGYLSATIHTFRPPSAGPFDGSARLSDLGIDSLQAVELKFGLDQLLGQELDVGLMIANPTIRQLAEESLRACGL